MRWMATKELTYTVCVEDKLVDPLVLFEYFQKMKVFSEVDDLPKDSEARKIAKWTACRVLEDYYGLDEGKAWDKRHSKRISNYLNRTSKTPIWMKKWVKPEPKLYYDKPINKRQEQEMLGLPMTLTEMFAEFEPKN